MPAIKIENLSFSYTDHNGSYEALRNVNLQIKSGQFVCILGQSGCGKSTLLRLLAGLQLPTKGEIRLDDCVVKGPGTDRAIVFQNYSLFPWMTARKNVQFGIAQANHSLSKTEVEQRAELFLTRVGMAEALERYPYQLSGGMRQRVAIARAFAMDAEIFLLDEPFGALDAKIRRELQMLLETLYENGGEKRKTVIFVTHDINEALLLADRIIFMRPGMVVADLAIDIPRPRRESGLERNGSYQTIKEELLDLFYAEAEKEDERESS